PRVDHRSRADPGADVHVARHHHDAFREERAVPGDRRRDDAHAALRVVALERDLVVVLKRPELDRLHPPLPEVVEDRRLRLLVHDPVVARALGDPDLAAVERRNRLVGRHSTSSRITAACSHSASVGTRAIRMYPSPASPREAPGATTMRCSSSRAAHASDASPPGTSTQRYIVASLAATRQPFRASTESSTSRFCPYAARVRTTCSSSPQATIDARWTNSCGAAPVDGREARSAPTRSGGPAT